MSCLPSLLLYAAHTIIHPYHGHTMARISKTNPYGAVIGLQGWLTGAVAFTAAVRQGAAVTVSMETMDLDKVMKMPNDD